MARKITSSTMRRAALVHKETGRCIAGIAFGPSSLRFLFNRSKLKDDEEPAWFDRCPVCDKEFRNEEEPASE